MREQMHAFWDDIQQAEAALEEGEPGALDRFMYAAGTMIENFRLAKSNFGKNRVSYAHVLFVC
jgi:general transcription factor 3C polypeptide 3 (transcription factor C subunit 4)